MNRKVILSVVASIIVLLVGIPFFMYGEDGYSFPQALLMVILIDLLCYSPAKLVISTLFPYTTLFRSNFCLEANTEVYNSGGTYYVVTDIL